MTLVPLAHSRLRIGFNRDESRRRATALPPEVRKCGDRRVIMPIDPVSGGTWIAVNDAGLAGAMLNAYGGEASDIVDRVPPRSRGTILPRLISHATIDEAEVGITNWEPGDFAPFRLVITDRVNVVEVHGNGRTIAIKRRMLTAAPRLFTSSGLGDQLVQKPRKQLFDEMLSYGSDPAATQDAFHRHQWPDHPELSVCMSRLEAATVSHVVLELSEGDASVTYYPAPPIDAVEPIRMSLKTWVPA